MKIIKVIRVGTFCLLCMGHTLFASENSGQNSQKEKVPLDSAALRIQNVKALAIGRFGNRIKFDKYGIPIEITGNLSKGLTCTDPVDQAYQFFEINKDIFQIASPREEFTIREVIKDDLFSTVKFYWTVNGTKVRYAGYFLQFSKNGSLYNISGQIDPEARNLVTQPTISKEQAGQLALNDSKAYQTTIENIKSTELTIGRFNNVLRLAWIINVCKLDSVLFNSDYYIDAQNGEILSIQTRIRD